MIHRSTTIDASFFLLSLSSILCRTTYYISMLSPNSSFLVPQSPSSSLRCSTLAARCHSNPTSIDKPEGSEFVRSLEASLSSDPSSSALSSLLSHNLILTHSSFSRSPTVIEAGANALVSAVLNH